jgi:hypothetical protein
LFMEIGVGCYWETFPSGGIPRFPRAREVISYSGPVCRHHNTSSSIPELLAPAGLGRRTRVSFATKADPQRKGPLRSMPCIPCHPITHVALRTSVRLLHPDGRGAACRDPRRMVQLPGHTGVCGVGHGVLLAWRAHLMSPARRRGSIGAGTGEQAEGEESQCGGGSLDVVFHGALRFGFNVGITPTSVMEPSHAGDPVDIRNLLLPRPRRYASNPLKCAFLGTRLSAPRW